MTPNEKRLRACLEKMEPDVHEAFLKVLSYLADREVKLSPSQIVTLVNSELEARQNEEILTSSKTSRQ